MSFGCSLRAAFAVWKIVCGHCKIFYCTQNTCRPLCGPLHCRQHYLQQRYCLAVKLVLRYTGRDSEVLVDATMDVTFPL
jgi:hypothetical protein